MRVIRGFLLLILAGAAMFPAAAIAAEQVDLLLVLAADVSRSVDNENSSFNGKAMPPRIFDPHVLDAVGSDDRPHRADLCRMVGHRLATGPDRLRSRSATPSWPRVLAIASWRRRAHLRTAPRSAARSSSP